MAHFSVIMKMKKITIAVLVPLIAGVLVLMVDKFFFQKESSVSNVGEINPSPKSKKTSKVSRKLQPSPLEIYQTSEELLKSYVSLVKYYHCKPENVEVTSALQHINNAIQSAEGSKAFSSLDQLEELKILINSAKENKHPPQRVKTEIFGKFTHTSKNLKEQLQ